MSSTNVVRFDFLFYSLVIFMCKEQANAALCYSCNITDVVGIEIEYGDAYDYQYYETDDAMDNICKRNPNTTTVCQDGCTKIDLSYKNPINGGTYKEFIRGCYLESPPYELVSQESCVKGKAFRNLFMRFFDDDVDTTSEVDPMSDIRGSACRCAQDLCNGSVITRPWRLLVLVLPLLATLIGYMLKS
ncbi:uncharacterized protein [Amphiura filiformis]|uniref:uncharacterized protein n=1 Tax=Amphiura filiformis TaxID=82378 RepID=UPI003B2167EC